ncbi:MAG TPA: hypothetical protein VK781_13265 [Solirubrobacteraceae bacterium]|jgi:AcrR family transcriptional regulator|nr:hypothetical protein [Solirubrobacteraceae bacterium]
MRSSAADRAAWERRTLQLRRERIMRAMVQAVCEEGFAGVSVASLRVRSKVSGRALYEAFDSRESCFLAVLDEGHRRASEVVSQAFEQTHGWLEGVRAALAGLLRLFDAEPGLARVCIVESLAAGPWALERREQHVAALTLRMAGYWGELAPQEPHPFANEGVVASVLGVIQNHLLAERPEPLVGMLGPLMGLVLAPYLDGQAVAEEVERSGALAQRLLGANDRAGEPQADAHGQELPELLRNPRASRKRECVRYLASNPGASNRQIARAVGVSHDPQISTLLARLAGAGLVAKRATGRGGPNEWTLTPSGVAAAGRLDDLP